MNRTIVHQVNIELIIQFQYYHILPVCVFDVGFETHTK